jgi:hypothetical protein
VVEYVGLTLAVSLAFGALGAAGPRLDGRSFGGFLAQRVVCAIGRGCDDGDRELTLAYGARGASLAREYAPSIVYEPGERSLPVDYRRCRSRRCADATEDRDLDVHRSHTGQRATAFVRLVRRRGRTYIEYWLYYPDSNTTWAASDKVWRYSPLRLLGRYPGYHLDDWEGYEVRVDPDGSISGRATAHGHYQGCKEAICKNRWMRPTGWTRVSRGSHAGHIPFDILFRRRPPAMLPWQDIGLLRFLPRYPGPEMRERTTTAEGVRLVPLERVSHRGYRPLDRTAPVDPPWAKRAYRDPASDES